jgi:hypothetical protein
MLHRRIVTGIDLGDHVDLNYSANGNLVRCWPLSDLDVNGARLSPAVSSGRLVGVIVTLGVNSGPGTLDALQVAVLSEKHCGDAVSVLSYPPCSECFYREDVAPSHSNTVALYTEMFGGALGDPQPYSDGLRLIIRWQVTGLVTCRVTVALLLEEDA